MARAHLSLVIEWENARHSEVARALAMLERLLAQIDETGAGAAGVEIFLVFDSREIDPRVVKAAAERLRERAGPELPVHEVPVPGGRYYQLKNEGARRASGEIILFLDSDVLPEAGWLRHLLATFQDPKVQVAVGNVHVDATRLYGRLFALTWYFPSRSADGPPLVSGTSMVNNIAMRRGVFDRHPFPDDPTLYIAQCTNWADALRQNGIDIYLNPSARVAHPPPRFFRSALINGHDVGRRLRRPGDGWKHAWRAAFGAFHYHVTVARNRIAAEHREVGLSRAGVPLALAVSSMYWVLWALAEAVSRWNPDVIRRRYGG